MNIYLIKNLLSQMISQRGYMSKSIEEFQILKGFVMDNPAFVIPCLVRRSVCLARRLSKLHIGKVIKC